MDEKGANPATVAARLMGLWEEDPFTCQVRLNFPYECPFFRDHWCSAAKVSGVRRGKDKSVALRCPEKDKEGKSIAPPKCPLRFGDITVKRVEHELLRDHCVQE